MEMDEKKYDLTVQLIMHSECLRWTRLNTLLIVASILLVAWVTLFKSNDIPLRPLLLIILSIVGVILCAPWSCLGHRSSIYVDKFNELAVKMEHGDGPLTSVSFPLRSRINGFIKLTSARTIVTAVPLMFATIFIILLIVSSCE